MQLTKWHNFKNAKPVWPGIYQVSWRGSSSHSGLFYNYWDGQNWHYGWRELEQAHAWNIYSGPVNLNLHQGEIFWRGLTEASYKEESCK